MKCRQRDAVNDDLPTRCLHRTSHKMRRTVFNGYQRDGVQCSLPRQHLNVVANQKSLDEALCENSLKPKRVCGIKPHLIKPP